MVKKPERVEFYGGRICPIFIFKQLKRPGDALLIDIYFR